jgi:hypothetical protein
MEGHLFSPNAALADPQPGILLHTSSPILNGEAAHENARYQRMSSVTVDAYKHPK